MLFPFIPPYCLKSIWRSMCSNSHATTKCSVTLLKNAVSEIGLKSSSVSGCATLPIGVTNSFFQCVGHVAVSTILLIILWRGGASSTENSFVICCGKSDGTPDRGFLALSIFLKVSSTLTTGGGVISVLSLVWTREGNEQKLRGGKVLLISEKWLAITSADC